jgi:sialic acid synthase SpsE
MGLAREFIRQAAAAGADYVKFQSWRASTVRDGASDPQYQWFVQSELSDAAHVDLVEECHRHGIGFMTTCFDVGRVEFLASLGTDVIKVGSPDLTSQRMLEALRERFRHVIVSTGVGTDAEVAQAADWLRGSEFTLLHCVSLYPMPPAQAHLKRMTWLRRFTPSVGWSDHATGTGVARLAIALGAAFVEKHFCLGRDGPGRAMAWDATPDELSELVRYAHEVEAIMGTESAPETPELAAAKLRFIGRWGNNA